MTARTIWDGSIEDVLERGEYDQGHVVAIDYDALYDFVEQAKQWEKIARMVALTATALTDEDLVNILERNTNQTLHPLFLIEPFVPFE
jgi:hypothetical protein